MGKWLGHESHRAALRMIFNCVATDETDRWHRVFSFRRPAGADPFFRGAGNKPAYCFRAAL